MIAEVLGPDLLAMLFLVALVGLVVAVVRGLVRRNRRKAAAHRPGWPPL